MKRKITSWILVLVFTIGGISLFNSCKDYEDDLRAEFKNGDAIASENLNQTKQDLLGEISRVELLLDAYRKKVEQDSIDGLRSDSIKVNRDSVNSYAIRIATLEAAKKTLEGRVDTLAELLKAAQTEHGVVTVDTLTAYYNRLNKEIEKTVAAAVAGLARVDSLQDVKYDTIISQLRNEIKGFNKYIYCWSDSLRKAQDTASWAYAQATLNRELIYKLDTITAALGDSVDSLRTDVTALKTAVDEAKALADSNLVYANKYADSVMVEALKIVKLNKDTLDMLRVTVSDLDKAYKSADSLLQDQLDSLNVRLTTAEGTILQNTQDILALNKKYNKLENALTHLVTGVIVQSVENPIFGTISLPIDVQSNVLMTVYGYSELSRDRDFPSASTATEFQGADTKSAYAFSAADINFLKTMSFSSTKIASGETLLDETEGNAGKVYVTVNPAQVDFTGVTLGLVNSQDQQSGISLAPLAKSDKVLSFGYTKAANNGFYEAKATLKKENIKDVKIDIEPGLKSAVGTVLKDWANYKVGSLSDYTTLASKLYRQFDGIVEAEGLKAAWTDSLGDHSVYSQYNVAATAVRPLSYKFLYGKNFAKLPTIDPINEDSLLNFDLNMDSIKFDFSFTIDRQPVTITLDSIHFTGDTIKVVIDSIPVSIDTIWNDAHDSYKLELTKKTDTIYIYDLINFVDSLNANLNGMIDGWGTNISTDLNNQIDSLICKIEGAVDDMSSSIQGQLNEVMSDLMESIKDQLEGKVSGYVGTMNNYINKLNSAVNRINGYLKDPNHYLQVAMFYQGRDGAYHQLSNSRSVPSVVTGAGSIRLIPTSYTAEIVAPAYKKFVAVTNVFKNGTSGVSAQGGDTNCINAAKAANAAGYFNTVFDGRQKSVAFQPTPGYTYEITYSGLDYSGYSSTRKFYVRVK